MRTRAWHGSAKVALGQSITYSAARNMVLGWKAVRRVVEGDEHGACYTQGRSPMEAWANGCFA